MNFMHSVYTVNCEKKESQLRSSEGVSYFLAEDLWQILFFHEMLTLIDFLYLKVLSSSYTNGQEYFSTDIAHC